MTRFCSLQFWLISLLGIVLVNGASIPRRRFIAQSQSSLESKFGEVDKPQLPSKESTTNLNSAAAETRQSEGSTASKGGLESDVMKPLPPSGNPTADLVPAAEAPNMASTPSRLSDRTEWSDPPRRWKGAPGFLRLPVGGSPPDLVLQSFTGGSRKPPFRFGDGLQIQGISPLFMMSMAQKAMDLLSEVRQITGQTLFQQHQMQRTINMIADVVLGGALPLSDGKMEIDKFFVHPHIIISAISHGVHGLRPTTSKPPIISVVKEQEIDSTTSVPIEHVTHPPDREMLEK